MPWFKPALRKLGSALKSNHDLVNNYVQVLAILLAGGWAFYTFVYVEYLKPAKEPPVIAVTASLTEVGRREVEKDSRKFTLIAVKAAVKATNNSKAQVAVVGAYFNVRAHKITPQASGGGQQFFDDVNRELKNRRGDTTVSAFNTLETQDGEIVHSSNLLQGWTMDPEDEYLRDTIFYVPEDRFDHLDIEFDIYVARNKEYTEQIERRWAAEASRGIFTQFFVRRDEDVPCDKEDPNRNCDPLSPGDNTAHQKLIDRYGMTHYDAISTLSVWVPRKEAQ